MKADGDFFGPRYVADFVVVVVVFGGTDHPPPIGPGLPH